jgi:tetratricopeptide (TPR) repeat protein
LFEGVGGAPPFDATTVQGLRDAAVAGRVAVPPRPIPRRLRAVIERGLAADPTARWPSMDALIDALASAIRGSPGPRRAVVLSTLSGIAAAIALSWPSSPSCAEDPALRWDDGARARVVEALDGAALPFVATMGPALLSELDGHADALVAAGVAVCWRGRDAVEPDFRAQGANCLADDRRALDEASAAIATGAAPELAVSLARVLALPDPAACVDPRHVALAHAVAPDDDDRVAIREELRELRSIQANLVYGPATPGYGAALDDSIARAEAVALRAEAAADPTQAAAAWLMHARLLLRRSDTAKADASVRRSLERANGLADPTLRVHATIQHVYVIGLDRDRADEAYALGEQARALIDAHGGERLLYAQLDNNLGLVAARDRRDRHASAERFGRAAVEGFTAALGEAHPDTLAARVNLAAGLNQASRPAEALAELAAAQPLAEATWGTDHPSTARLLTVVGNAHLRLGDLDASEQAQRDSLEIQRRCFGPDDGEVANAQYNLALVLRRRGRHDEAATLLLRAIAIREALVGADAPELILWLLPTGESLVESGRAADAVAPLRRALALCEADGAPAKDFARVRFALARALEESAPIEALALADAARAWFAAQDDREAVGRVDVLRARLGAPVDG